MEGGFLDCSFGKAWSSCLLLFLLPALACAEPPDPAAVLKSASATDLPLNFLKTPADAPVALFEYDSNSFKTSHPRLPVPSAQYLDQLRANSAIYSSYKRLADQVTPGQAMNMDQASALLIYALASQDPTYLAKIKPFLSGGLPNYATWAQLYWQAYAYDWFYDRFSSDERTLFQQSILTALGHLEDDLVLTAPSPFNDVGYNRFEGAVLTASLAIHPDHARAMDHLRFALAYVNDILAACHHITGRTGGWHEGFEYYTIGISKVVTRIFSEWRAASGQDLFAANPWIEGMIFYPIYKLRPDRTPSRWGDMAWSLSSFDNATYPLSVAYANPLGLWFSRRMSPTPGGTFGVEQQPTGLKPSLWPWGEPDRTSLTEIPIASLPLDWLFEGTGEVVMRSGWTEDDTMIEFKAGPHYWSHSNLDQGAFTIYHRGALAIDSGAYYYYGDDHHLNYRRQAISKNTILVYDPADSFALPDGRSLANDGGQRRIEGAYGVGAPSAYMDENYIDSYFAWADAGRQGAIPVPPGPSSLDLWKSRSSTFDMGRILAFDSSPSFSYVSADLTLAYNNENSGINPVDRTPRVRSLTRSLLFLSRKYLVVYDAVDAVDPSFEKRWLLHSINEPSISGQDFTIVRADTVLHHYSFPEGLKYRTSDRRSYQYNGMLLGRTLLPANPRITSIGGPGREFEVNVGNYNKSNPADTWYAKDGFIITDPKVGPQEPGNWRLEISPTDPEETTYFLHFLYPTEYGGAELPPTTLLRGDGYQGLAVHDDSAAWIALFAAPGPDQMELSYESPVSSPVTHCIVGLRPGAYAVYQGDSMLAKSVTVSSQGVLQFAAEGPGSFRIVLLPPPEPQPDPEPQEP